MVEFVSDRISCLILRGRWCEIMVLNVRAPKVDKIYDMKAACMRNSNVYSKIS
jgi:hypothetical protein